MAYINGEFEHPYLPIKIMVLEPTKDENDYKQGLKISVEWSSVNDVSLIEFRVALKWMAEKADFIESTFTKSGKAKKISIKGLSPAAQ